MERNFKPASRPCLDPVLVAAFQAVEPAYADHPDSAREAADFDVDDTIGGE